MPTLEEQVNGLITVASDLTETINNKVTDIEDAATAVGASIQVTADEAVTANTTASDLLKADLSDRLDEFNTTDLPAMQAQVNASVGLLGDVGFDVDITNSETEWTFVTNVVGDRRALSFSASIQSVSSSTVLAANCDILANHHKDFHGTLVNGSYTVADVMFVNNTVGGDGDDGSLYVRAYSSHASSLPLLPTRVVIDVKNEETLSGPSATPLYVEGGANTAAFKLIGEKATTVTWAENNANGIDVSKLKVGTVEAASLGQLQEMWVDIETGNDETAKVNSSSYPFQTYDAALEAVAVGAHAVINLRNGQVFDTGSKNIRCYARSLQIKAWDYTTKDGNRVAYSWEADQETVPTLLWTAIEYTDSVPDDNGNLDDGGATTGVIGGEHIFHGTHLNIGYWSRGITIKVVNPTGYAPSRRINMRQLMTGWGAGKNSQWAGTYDGMMLQAAYSQFITSGFQVFTYLNGSSRITTNQWDTSMDATLIGDTSENADRRAIHYLEGSTIALSTIRLVNHDTTNSALTNHTSRDRILPATSSMSHITHNNSDAYI